MRTAVLVLLCAASLAGQLGSIDGTVVDRTGSKPLAGVHVRLYIAPTPQMAKEVYGAMTDADGRHSVATIQPGTYTVVLERAGFVAAPTNKSFPYGVEILVHRGEHRYSVRLTWGAYVQSMRLGSTDIDGEILDLRYGLDGATLTLYASSTTGEIAGVVHNSGGPAAHAHVVLLEEGTGGWPWVIGVNSEGRYSFPNLRPGKYRLVVLDSGPANAMALRFQMFDYADIVESVELGAGEKVTRDLRRHDGK